MNNGAEPIDDPEKTTPSPWAIAGAVLVVLLSSLIAFCCTCFPAGLLTFEVLGGPILHQATPQQMDYNNRIIIFACVVGAIWAILVGWWVALLFRKSWSKR